MINAAARPNWHDIYFTSHDGLKLYARHYPAQSDLKRRPVLCLAGLTRNCKDFHTLATFLSEHSEQPRDVFCLDYRGRGKSEYDKNWENYSPFIELIDTLNLMTIEQLHNAAIIGTSRGGIIAMLMATIRPTAIGSVILNDIGPVIETAGLTRIKGYVGLTPDPESWEEAAQILEGMNRNFFPALTSEDWIEVAYQCFNEDEEGEPVAAYDPLIARSLAMIDLTKEMPTMWPQYIALSRFPTLVIRGGNSDLLSTETVKQMAERHHRFETFTAPDEGHAPLLRDNQSQARISDFLTRTDFGLTAVADQDSTAAA